MPENTDNILNILVKLGVVGQSDLVAAKQLLEETGRSAATAGKALAETERQLLAPSGTYGQLKQLAPEQEQNHKADLEPDPLDSNRDHRPEAQKSPEQDAARLATADDESDSRSSKNEKSEDKPLEPAGNMDEAANFDRTKRTEVSRETDVPETPEANSSSASVAKPAPDAQRETPAIDIAGLIRSHQSTVEEQWKFLAKAYVDVAGQNAQAWQQLVGIFSAAANNEAALAAQIQAVNARLTAVQAQIRQTAYTSQ